jgi:hypothetical protein
MAVMAKPQKKKPNRSGTPLGTTVDEDIRAAIDTFIAEHNTTAEHPASVRSTVESALRGFLFVKGHWPHQPTWLSDYLARAGEADAGK